MILVTGATGNVGAELVRQMAETELRFKAMSRDPKAAKAKLPAGVNVIPGDYDDPESLAAAMKDVDTVVLISPAHPDMVKHQTAVIDAALSAGVRDIVKLSGLGADLDAPIRLPKHHAEIEAYAEDRGLRLTAVRPNLFMQVLLGERQSIFEQGAIYAPTGTGEISFTDIRDVAAVILAILKDELLRGTVHEITGPEALSYAEAARRIGKAIDSPVTHVDVADPTARDALLSMKMDPWVIEAFIELFGIYRAGYGSAVFSNNVFKATGHPARGFDAFAEEFKPVGAVSA